MLTVRRNQEWLPNLFNEIFDNNLYERASVSATTPAVNVLEKEHEYLVEVAAPGMTKNEFKVNLDEDENLVVALEKEANKEEEGKKMHYLRREFSYSQFRQTMILPDDVDKEKISAKVENGVLSVILPKMNPQELKKANKVIDIM
ncbi:MAG: Hsp20/alpha crystallin family protein [Bacteroidales bacterium]|nr:Hsp20/alpha crystallin family protein [Bacteroidales bacterium]